MSKWMTLFTDASTAFAVDPMGQMQANQARDEMDCARAAFVALLLGVCENQVVLKALSRPQAAAARKAMSEGLATFVPTIMHNAGPVTTRLDHFRTRILASFEPAEAGKPLAAPELDQLFDSGVELNNFVIPELPVANSRAGLYIYLNAALVGRPLIDDTAIFNYLNNRYQGDVQSTTIDLILASFDVLANAVFRNEGNKAAHMLRSYLMNKLPILISNLSKHMYPPLTAEYCITEALSHVDTNAFPTLSSMFDESRNNNPYTDSVREEFCWACCLHGLLRESSIETILGETPYQSLPSRGRYVKDTLVAECLDDPERMQALVKELDNMDGNVGAVCHALTEVLAQLCRNKETMSLKNLCSQLSRRPLSLDVILLFEKPTAILQPLCDLLDDWKYDEDQGEYQPVYEEFGSVLLLLLAFTYRYNLTASDIGARSPDSFVAKFLSQGHLSRSSEELSDLEKSHLGGWIHGLFDQEAGGLTDDLISSCPPQEFYLLIPTLFQNVVTAFATGHLSEESLKGGVEYLVDTFLLPSLVTAITYLANSLWVERHNQNTIIRVLHLVLQPSAISEEAKTMLSSVLNIVAKPLEHSLRASQRQDPKNQKIDPLLGVLKDNIPLSRRTGGADHNELETWTSTQGEGLATALRHTMQGFVQWSLHPGINITPTSYSHRQVLAALRLLGAKRVFRLICEEVKQQTEAGGGSVVYDVATALDSGNMPTPVQRRLTLRDAELVVRLHRRVEAQMAVSEAEAIHAEAILQGDLGLGLDDAAGSLSEAMAAAAANAGPTGGAMTIDSVGLDLGMGGVGGDLDLGDATGNGGSLDLGADDIFSGLSAGGDFEWDTMDLG
ncbi:Mediator of RNA polymerase II transcription subunit 5 like protein [Verticillium longisporum]|nr:Mediator of RNA polymerase II transcription subunit 5 like protein [Verticillium longisporum]